MTNLFWPSQSPATAVASRRSRQGASDPGSEPGSEIYIALGRRLDRPAAETLRLQLGDRVGGGNCSAEATGRAKPYRSQPWVFDLSQVEFIDSAGLGALVWAHSLARQQGTIAYFCALPAPVQLLFEITQLDRVFPLYPSPEVALSRQASPAAA